MSTFHLQIVTPDRMAYDGQAERVILRTVNGDVAILGAAYRLCRAAGHWRSARDR